MNSVSNIDSRNYSSRLSVNGNNKALKPEAPKITIKNKKLKMKKSDAIENELLSA